MTFNEESILYSKEILREVDWTYRYNLSNPNQAYSHFLRTFSGMCNYAFPVNEMIIKLKSFLSPWISEGL